MTYLLQMNVKITYWEFDDFSLQDTRGHMYRISYRDFMRCSHFRNVKVRVLSLLLYTSGSLGYRRGMFSSIVFQSSVKHPECYYKERKITCLFWLSTDLLSFARPVSLSILVEFY